MVIYRGPKGNVPVSLMAGVFLLLALPIENSLDPREVTNEDYQRFIRTTGHQQPEHWNHNLYPEGTGNDPVVLVTWHDAITYCQWAGGKRLPTVDEWMGACETGSLGKIGDVWEWTSTEVPGEGGNFIALCGPMDTCDCSHRYRPHWKNAVKGFRCVGGNQQMTSVATPNQHLLTLKR